MFLFIKRLCFVKSALIFRYIRLVTEKFSFTIYTILVCIIPLLTGLVKLVPKHIFQLSKELRNVFSFPNMFATGQHSESV